MVPTGTLLCTAPCDRRYGTGGLQMRAAISAVAISMALGLGACGGSGGGGSDTGRLSLGVTDAPVDEASSVVVQFSGVAFKRAGAAPELVQNLTPSPRQLDLLQYQGGRAALLLDGVTLPAGDYRVGPPHRRQRAGRARFVHRAHRRRGVRVARAERRGIRPEAQSRLHAAGRRQRRTDDRFRSAQVDPCTAGTTAARPRPARRAT